MTRAAPSVRHAELALPGLAGDRLPPLVCRWPAGAPPKGWVIFCHGLGASGRDYAALSDHWAQGGYLVIHPTFPDWIGAVVAVEPALGVDPAADHTAWAIDPRLRPRMYDILHAPDFWLRRISITRRVLDDLGAVFAGTGGAPRLSKGAIAGHSFGAYTAQLLAGAEIDLPGEGPRRFRDDRFAAAILLSAQGRDQQGLRQGSWDGITGPMLNVTGTRDGGARGQDWRWKVEPYELAPAGDKYLALIEDGDHYLGGVARPDQSPVPEHLAAVKRLTLAFLDAHVAGETAALSWLAGISDRIGDCRLDFRRK